VVESVAAQHECIPPLEKEAGAVMDVEGGCQPAHFGSKFDLGCSSRLGAEGLNCGCHSLAGTGAVCAMAS
jgi:hypothetical protein